MSVLHAVEEGQRLVLDDVPWRTYTRLLRLFDERRLRLTYDRGTLEIMTLTHEHEGYSYILGRFVDALTEELGLPIKGGHSTTFRRRKRQRGLEPDNCSWIASEPRVRGKTKIDLQVDPPPDLAIEIDITSSSLDRMGIYADLGVPEVWRFADQALTFHVLGDARRYALAPRSAAFPSVMPEDVLRFLALRTTHDENAVVRELRDWVRARIATDPRNPAS
ncbi:MAG TPA: Uma2 family endonuclease [Isosphaeraceae bacterium]|jgi:Uma2 family endonuclease